VSSEWVHRDKVLEQATWAAKERIKLTELLLEATAIITRLDRNGYQSRFVQRVYRESSVTAEKVDELNAKVAAKAAEYRAKREASE